MQAGEPGDVAKIELLEGLSVSLWDRWEVRGAVKTLTLQAMIKKIEQQYKGLEVRDVMKGNQPIFFHAIMNDPSKANDKQTALATPIHKLADCCADDFI